MKKFFKMILFFMLILFSLYAIAYLFPAPTIGLDHSIEMYDKDGELFYASCNDHSGTYVRLDDVSDHFLNAIIAIEDQHFYHHAGFDIVGIARAMLVNLSTGSLSQGGSTITQQYMKNLFLNNETTWSRKLKEAWLTIRTEVHYEKEAILEGYINTLYFGDGVYGIENAANYYFNKSAKDLSILEGSLLAGMVNGPELYSPYRNYALTKERQQLVLLALKEQDYLLETEYQRLKDEDTTLYKHQSISDISTLGYFRQLVYEELSKLGYDHYDGILKIHTTLDSPLQQQLTTSINQHSEDELQKAVVIMEPGTGALRVVIGGKDYAKSQYNRVTLASRQMASTIKPLLYYEALINGFHPLSKFISEKTTFYLDYNQTYSPTNYNDQYPNRDITMIEALASSDNIYAVKMHLFLGEEALSERLKRLGYEDIEAHASLALGSEETTPLQLCSLYNCIASKGMYYEPYCIEAVSNGKGQDLYQHQIKGEKKLDEDYCLVLSQLLTATFLSDLNGTMANYKTNTTFAAKTGTSDWDSWLVAYHPELCMVMWAGYDQPMDINYTQQFQLRTTFYEVFKNSKEVKWYMPSSKIVQIPIDLSNMKMSQDGEIFWFYQNSQKFRI